MATLPCIGFFAALPLLRNIDLGEWEIGVPPDETSWRSERFKELVQQLLNSFAHNDSGERFENGAVIWNKTSGFDGSRPNDDEIRAIQAAVRFASLDCNDHISKDDPNGAHHVVSSENAALHIQPIDEQHGYITHLQPGFVKRVLGGGWKIGDKPPPLDDATFPILGHVPASRTLARAVFQAHMSKGTDVLRRLCVAVEWHAIALSNAVAVTLQQRIIALKTGFEALIASSDSRTAACRVRALFEKAAYQHHDLFPTPNVLWCPKERTDLKRRWGKKDELRSELEDWFLALADARNKIIHEGRVPDLVYAAPPERPLSRYAGHIFWKGERVLREAIKATLGTDILLCGPLQERARWQKLYDQLAAAEKARDSRADTPDSGAQPDATVQPAPARTVAELLGKLGAPAANHVLITRALPQASASPEVLDAVGATEQPGWVAKYKGIEMGIWESERELLLQEGAEDELPDHLSRCD